MKYYISSNPDNLAEALSQHPNTATVEAEYGDRLVEGTILTLAHHGVRSGNPAPCLYNGPSRLNELDAIGLSHLDLDSVGGVLGVIGYKVGPESFWKLAAFVDVNGPHKLSQAGASREDIDSLYAYWAWAENHKVFPPKDGSVVEVTDQIATSAAALTSIFNREPSYMKEGEEFRRKGEELNLSSFRGCDKIHGVILRSAPAFTNHLYVTPEGFLAKVVVAYREDFKSVTVSLADPIPGVSCRELVQELWGPLAGGHDGIAGSPRGKEMTFSDAVDLYNLVVSKL